MLTITSCRALNEEAEAEVILYAKIYRFRGFSDTLNRDALRAAVDSLDALERRNIWWPKEAAQAHATPGGEP